MSDPQTPLERAIAIAVQAHTGRQDKASAPYILHPLRVMLRQAGETAMIVAVLHDVVEDSDWTFERLRSEGFSEEVIEALDAITKRTGEDYDSFVERAMSHPVARRVKLADLEDNLDVRRLSDLARDDVDRLRKYMAAWKRWHDRG